MVCSKLVKLRVLLEKHGVDAYVVPSEDAHCSEYVGERDKRRQFMCGLSGSAGTVLVTKTKALVWADSRYWDQARKELGQDWTLMESGRPTTKTIPEFLATELQPGALVGFNPLFISVSLAKKWDKHLLNECPSCKPITGRPLGSETKCDRCVLLRPILEDLVDQVWADQPAQPANPIQIHPLEFAGEAASAKITKLRSQMKAKGADCIVLTTLADIAWLLNLRGNDISLTPVFYSYLLVSHDQVILFCAVSALAPAVKTYLLDSVGVDEIHAYDEFLPILKSMCDSEVSDTPKEKRRRTVAKEIKKWWIVPTTSLGVQLICASKTGSSQIFALNPVWVSKAMKNEAELEAMANTHIVEGVALCRFFAWLENAVVKDSVVLDEVDTMEKIEFFRSQHVDYRGPSFETIAAADGNGSQNHYHARRGSCNKLTKSSMFLCDTGGQYASGGTTDMTRTVHFGEPSEFQILAYTLVLEGHVDLSMAVFPEGTEGVHVDILARLPLYKHGLTFRHGTGHGVGSYLGVHEAPPSVNNSIPEQREKFEGYASTAMRNHMVLSNEPGYYQTDEFGIRIENLMMTRECKPEKFKFGAKFKAAQPWLEFETITLVPYERKLINKSMLTQEKIDWINEYHKRCEEVLMPLLQEKNDTLAIQWLKAKTRPL
mmetsp:Transcript_39217/g.63678  ORF Transcript_39217/g.63678 Transcript_39217/m.63678 type:complete len:659 (-) Transcript_39217:9-1985(-)